MPEYIITYDCSGGSRDKLEEALNDFTNRKIASTTYVIVTKFKTARNVLNCILSNLEKEEKKNVKRLYVSKLDGTPASYSS